MATKSDQFKAAFREEGREIVADLESALLELNGNRGDRELVGRVFRGLHTVKGSGAMFGFEDLAAFTHSLENAFDEVRNGRLEIGPELIDMTLSALDQIRAMLEQGESGAPGPDACACAQILAKLRKLTGKPPVQGAAESCAAPGTGCEAATGAPAGGGSGPMRRWSIHFAPGAEFMSNGANPLLLLRELGQLGNLSVTASLASLPPLSELEPERCYVSWEMELDSAAERDAIRDVFIFVEDSCELTIEAAPGNSCSDDPAPGGDRTPPAAPTAAAGGGAADRTARALEEKRAASGGRRAYDAPDHAASLRVPASKLDQFVNLVGELVTVQARLSEIAAQRDDVEVTSVSEEIERLTSSLRENSMNIRMTPVRATFEKFRRLVHDLARDLGKNVELTIEGADTELDKTVIDQLGDPLMHLIRNSMDHGIEPPEVRVSLGKRPMAAIHLSARHSGASVLIEVSDDGRGIDREAVQRRAVERGLAAAGAELSEEEAFALLFQPGFSTARQVTDVSGRGVGMDVVRQRVDGLRGSIEVSSKPGRGTRMTLRLPLTLAIIDGLLVNIGDACFVLPLANILECVELTAAEIERAGGKPMVNVRGEVVPYIRLRERFNIHTRRPEIEQIMVVQTGQGRYGFVVDRVLGSCQTVIKNLGRFYRHVQSVSGATILGNGTVALILDPERLVQDAVRTLSQSARGRMAGAAFRHGNGREGKVSAQTAF